MMKQCLAAVAGAPAQESASVEAVAGQLLAAAGKGAPLPVVALASKVA